MEFVLSHKRSTFVAIASNGRFGIPAFGRWRLYPRTYILCDRSAVNHQRQETREKAIFSNDLATKVLFKGQYSGLRD